MTTHVTAFGLSLINVPIYVESHFIHIPEGRFSIEEVCAGLRYLLAALVVALIYVYLYIERRKNQWLFIGFVVVLSLAVNWIRVFTVIFAGHLTNMNHSLVKDHADFGWWLFAFTLIPIFWFGRYLIKKEQGSATQHEVSVSQESDERDDKNSVTISAGSARYLFIVLFILVLAVPLSGFYLKSRHMTDSPLVDLKAPRPAGYWRGPYEIQQQASRPAFAGADREVFAGYENEDREVVLYVAQYFYQQQGKELISEYNHLYNPSIWQPRSQTGRQIPLSDGSMINVKEIVVRNEAGRRRLLWYWYSIAGTNSADPVKAKILQVKSLFASDASGSSIILMMVGADRGIDSARNTLSNYLTAMYDGINTAIYAKD
jgi:EpsI family protein